MSTSLQRLVALSVYVVLPSIYPAVVHAQAGSPLAFEVTTVKASPPSVTSGSIEHANASGFSLLSSTVTEAMRLAYSVRPWQILGGPPWLAKNRYDLGGKNPPGDPEALLDQSTDRLKTLLADRFGLKVHTERRLLAGYWLVVTNPAKLTAAPCSPMYRVQRGWVSGSVSLRSLTSLMKAEMRTQVEDRTNMTGCFQMDTQWSTDPADTERPQLATALAELGLKLQPAKVDTEVLVVDAAELPQPD